MQAEVRSVLRAITFATLDAIPLVWWLAMPDAGGAVLASILLCAGFAGSVAANTAAGLGETARAAVGMESDAGLGPFPNRSLSLTFGSALSVCFGRLLLLSAITAAALRLGMTKMRCG